MTSSSPWFPPQNWQVGQTPKPRLMIPKTSSSLPSLQWKEFSAAFVIDQVVLSEYIQMFLRPRPSYLSFFCLFPHHSYNFWVLVYMAKRNWSKAFCVTWSRELTFCNSSLVNDTWRPRLHDRRLGQRCQGKGSLSNRPFPSLVNFTWPIPLPVTPILFRTSRK